MPSRRSAARGQAESLGGCLGPIARRPGLLGPRAVAARRRLTAAGPWVAAALDRRLRGYLDRLAFAALHRNLAGAGRLLLGQRQLQHAVLERRLGLLGVYARGQRHAAHVAAVAVLLVMHGALLTLAVLFLAVHLALDHKLIALHGDVDVFRLHAGHRRLHDQVFVVLGDVDRHRHAAAVLAAADPAWAHPGVFEEPVHRHAQRLHVAVRIPSLHRHDLVPSLAGRLLEAVARAAPQRTRRPVAGLASVDLASATGWRQGNQETASRPGPRCRRPRVPPVCLSSLHPAYGIVNRAECGIIRLSLVAILNSAHAEAAGGPQSCRRVRKSQGWQARTTTTCWARSVTPPRRRCARPTASSRVNTTRT